MRWPFRAPPSILRSAGRAASVGFMPLSLKFLIDDALGEEDFQALYTILGVLAAAGIITSIVAVWYERWDARLAASVISDVRSRLFEHVQDLPSAYFARTRRGEIL